MLSLLSISDVFLRIGFRGVERQEQQTQDSGRFAILTFVLPCAVEHHGNVIVRIAAVNLDENELPSS